MGIGHPSDYDHWFYWVRYSAIPYVFKDLWFYEIPWFFRNLRKFLGFLWIYRNWDSWYWLHMNRIVIEDMMTAAASADRYMGVEEVTLDMKRLLNGLDRLSGDLDGDEDYMYDAYEIVKNLPPERWPCQCGGTEEVEGVFRKEEKYLHPCIHIVKHFYNAHKNLEKWVFDEIRRNYSKWWY